MKPAPFRLLRAIAPRLMPRLMPPLMACLTAPLAISPLAIAPPALAAAPDSPWGLGAASNSMASPEAISDSAGPLSPPAPMHLSWQNPPEPIGRLLDTPAPPDLFLAPGGRYGLEMTRPPMPTLADLAQPEVAVGGIKLNPNTNGPASPYSYNALVVVDLPSGDRRPVALPPHFRINFLRWSPEGDRAAFVRTTALGLELWVLELASATARPVTGPILNGTYGNPCAWLPGGAGFVCKTVPSDRGEPPNSSPIPDGPTVEENLGRKAPTRTYQNLLRDRQDEALFEYYLTAQLERIDLEGNRTPLGTPAIIDEVVPSPDGRYLLLETLHRPFSYQVPASRFPKRIAAIATATGATAFEVAQLPLADDVPVQFSAVRRGRRDVGWRSDQPATLYWVEALDDGDATQPAPHRDAVYLLPAPFEQPPQELWRSEYRYAGLLWGRDRLALAYEWWYDQRLLRLWQLDPSQPGKATLVSDRNYQDAYSDLGEPLLEPGPHGRPVLRLAADGESLYFAGRGASPEGVYPFLDRRHLPSGTVERLWQSADPHYETVVDLLDREGHRLITRRQSKAEPPNYWLRDRTGGDPQPLTHQGDPMPEFAGLQKEILQYQRADGVALTATLYLPPGHDRDRDGPLPTVLWVYPEEHADRDTAGQVLQSPNTFSRPRHDSILFLLLRGYAVLLDPSLPIVGENGSQPNDTYIEQLVAGAEAAVNTLVDRGISDRDRLVVGGHSYGAFTVAHLLAHTDLFQAGIARSGAYNRTLTPFGFQGEQRTFWEAPDAYTRLSPFTHADKINEPLLLIHGEKDSNPGTYPIQSERLYEALRGLGGTVRLVKLPLEDHGYRSREAIGHVLWEMLQWCDRYGARRDSSGAP